MMNENRRIGWWTTNAENIRQEEKCFRDLENIWRECGYDVERCQSERTKVEARVVALLQQIVKELTVDNKTAVKKEVFSQGNSFEFSDKKPILENFFIKNEGICKEESLCEPLGKSFSDPLSPEEKLRLLKDFVKEKDGGKEVLSQAYNSVKEVIDNIGKELEWAKSLLFEYNIVSSSITSEFTKECKEKLESFHRKLEVQLEERKSRLPYIHTKLASVWQALDKDICDRRCFFSDLSCCARSTIEAITEELSCLENIRKSKFQQFIDFSRKELDSWWEKCFYSEQQKNEFYPFYSTDYSEELLKLHEQELRKVKTFYNNNIGIFRLVHQRQKLWNTMIDIENKAYDPSRLFDNRGGQLLQEEKDKKMVQKDLPKIEEEVLKLSKAYKQKNGHDFLLNGRALAEAIKQQKIEYQKSKDQKRLERKLAREQERSLDVVSAAKSITKGNCRKRKLCDTPSAEASSCKRPMLRSLQSASCSGKVLRPIQNTVKSCKTAKKILNMNGPSWQEVFN